MVVFALIRLRNTTVFSISTRTWSRHLFLDSKKKTHAIFIFLVPVRGLSLPLKEYALLFPTPIIKPLKAFIFKAFSD